MLKTNIKNKIRGLHEDKKLCEMIINYLERNLIFDEEGYCVITGESFIHLSDCEDYIENLIYNAFGHEIMDLLFDIIEDISNDKILLIDSDDGEKNWYQHGERHRLNGPANIESNGYQAWWLDGKCHRLDGPAIIQPDGGEEWVQYNKRHRDDGPAVIWADGTELWYMNDKKHREDGPAVIHGDGTKEWFVNGIRHREDGPALIKPNGHKRWYRNGRLYK